MTRSNIVRALKKGEAVDVRLAHLLPHAKITVREFDGRAFEFGASKEVLRDTKVGEGLEVTKHILEGCK